MNTIKIFQGSQCSGKTTTAQKLIEKNGADKSVYLDTDNVHDDWEMSDDITLLCLDGICGVMELLKVLNIIIPYLSKRTVPIDFILIAQTKIEHFNADIPNTTVQLISFPLSDDDHNLLLNN